MKKITMLDAYTADMDDDLLNQLKSYGEVSFYMENPHGDIYDIVKDSNCIFTDSTPVDEDLIKRCLDLEYIGIMATGTDSVDLNAATEKGIAVTNVPAYSTSSVAQHTFALILSISNHIASYAEFVADGSWSAGKGKNCWDMPHMELAGKTLGILGYGNISKEVIRIAGGFGMKILVSTEHPDSGDKPDRYNENVEFTDLNKLLEEADVISIHKPYKKENMGIIGEKELSSMKKDAILISTSRGGIVNESALAEALESGRIRAAALDVMEKEPPDKDNPLLKCKNCLLTPHVGFAGEEARKILRETIVHNYVDYLNGKETNRIV